MAEEEGSGRVWPSGRFWVPSGRFSVSKSKKFDFFFGSQMGFYMVWEWFGVFINGFWTYLVDFWVACVSKWLKRRGAGGFGQVVDFGVQVVDFGRQNRKISIFFFGSQMGFYMIWG